MVFISNMSSIFPCLSHMQTKASASAVVFMWRGRTEYATHLSLPIETCKKVTTTFYIHPSVLYLLSAFMQNADR